MKKLFILIVIIFLSLTFIQSKADCPPGWVERNLTINGEYPGCPNSVIVVKMCVLCSITSDEMRFTINEVVFQNGMCTPFYWPSFMDYLSARILANYFEFCTGAWTPCNSGFKDVYVKKPLCFYESPDPNQNGDFLYCNPSWCVEHWRVCNNGNEVIKTLVSKWVEGTPYPGCLNTEWDDNLPKGTCFHAVNCQ